VLWHYVANWDARPCGLQVPPSQDTLLCSAVLCVQELERSTSRVSHWGKMLTACGTQWLLNIECSHADIRDMQLQSWSTGLSASKS
jgi:hypothetical protein